jgi:16S rRNA G966 N2-methylase RsmD
MDYKNRIRTILRIFPPIVDENMNNNYELLSKLLIDNDSLYYISIREYAQMITNIIKNHLEQLLIDSKSAIISDATAGVGGDTISFGHVFNHVYAIEDKKQRADYLKNNVKIYKLDNVSVYNSNCIYLLNKITNHNVIFIDPPWESYETGSYKQYTNLRLKFCNKALELFVNDLIDYNKMRKVPELIVLKLPKNYDLKYFYKNVIGTQNIYYYDLTKMIILVLVIKKDDNKQINIEEIT